MIQKAILGKVYHMNGKRGCFRVEQYENIKKRLAHLLAFSSFCVF